MVSLLSSVTLHITTTLSSYPRIVPLTVNIVDTETKFVHAFVLGVRVVSTSDITSLESKAIPRILRISDSNTSISLVPDLKILNAPIAFGSTGMRIRVVAEGGLCRGDAVTLLNPVDQLRAKHEAHETKRVPILTRVARARRGTLIDASPSPLAPHDVAQSATIGSTALLRHVNSLFRPFSQRVDASGHYSRVYSVDASGALFLCDVQVGTVRLCQASTETVQAATKESTSGDRPGTASDSTPLLSITLYDGISVADISLLLRSICFVHSFADAPQLGERRLLLEVDSTIHDTDVHASLLISVEVSSPVLHFALPTALAYSYHPSQGRMYLLHHADVTLPERVVLVLGVLTFTLETPSEYDEIGLDLTRDKSGFAITNSTPRGLYSNKLYLGEYLATPTTISVTFRQSSQMSVRHLTSLLHNVYLRNTAKGSSLSTSVRAPIFRHLTVEFSDGRTEQVVRYRILVRPDESNLTLYCPDASVPCYLQATQPTLFAANAFLLYEHDCQSSSTTGVITHLRVQFSPSTPATQTEEVGLLCIQEHLKRGQGNASASAFHIIPPEGGAPQGAGPGTSVFVGATILYSNTKVGTVVEYDPKRSVVVDIQGANLACAQKLLREFYYRIGRMDKHTDLKTTVRHVILGITLRHGSVQEANLQIDVTAPSQTASTVPRIAVAIREPTPLFPEFVEYRKCMLRARVEVVWSIDSPKAEARHRAGWRLLLLDFNGVPRLHLIARVQHVDP